MRQATHPRSDTYVLRAFRRGADTTSLAFRFGLEEWDIYNAIARAREAERDKKRDGKRDGA